MNWVRKMTSTELWKPDDFRGTPVRVGEWLYEGIPLAVRLFEIDTLYGSGDESDDPEVANDQALACFYIELQVIGEDRWGAGRQFCTLEDVERFGREQLGGTLRWYEKTSK